MEIRDFTHTGYALLQEWYHQMVSQHTEKTIMLKQVIDEKLDSQGLQQEELCVSEGKG